MALILSTFPVSGARGIQAADWPHWRGTARSGITTESSGYRDGLWPLTEVWTTGFGDGASAPIVADGRLFTLGWKDGKEHVYCRDAESGAEIWTASYSAPKYGRFATGDQSFYSGPSSAPTYDPESRRLYTLGIDGDLRCWDVNPGVRPVWSINLYDQFKIGQRPAATQRQASRRDYGYTTSPLLYGSSVIVEVGAADGNLMGFDKRTGKLLWKSQNTDPAGHSAGPTPIIVDSLPCVVVFTLRGLHAARLDQGNEGRTVAEYEWTTDYANIIASPAVHSNYVLISSGYNRSAMVKLKITLKGAEEVWRIRLFSPVCTPIIHMGNVYWTNRGLWCVDFETGAAKWNGGRFGDAAGSCIVTADDRILIWANDGDLALAETAKRSPGEYRELSWKGGILRSEAWPHLALARGRVYLRDRGGNMKCFSIGAAEKARK